LQTLLVWGLVVVVWWVVWGFVYFLGVLRAPTPGRRGWDIATGAVSVLAGGFLVVNPQLSLGVLVVVACLWLFGVGLFAVVAAFRLRSHRDAGPAVPPPGQPVAGVGEPPPRPAQAQP
jgi:uncharacterized membrane protein HdeD (DUF308 family)